MGTVVWLKSIRIEVRSRENNHLGRPHCHAVKDDASVSIDLNNFSVLEVSGFTRGDVKSIVEVVKQHQEELMAEWRRFHGES